MENYVKRLALRQDKMKETFYLENKKNKNIIDINKIKKFDY